MGISSALFSGVSGLNTLGNSMSVIGDNIANVNTIGFKSSRSTFETVLAQSISGASGTSQVGRGVALSAIDANFSQGSFESTNEPTDMAIGGKGFFMVRSEETGLYYTRAGHFRFDEDGYLVNPADLNVQGWMLDPASGEDDGGITDIQIDISNSAPNPTSEINIAANLDSAAPILNTGATVSSEEDSSNGFVFRQTGSNPNDNLDLNAGTDSISMITDGGLEADRVYSGAEVADALETALNTVLPGAVTVVYNSAAGAENTFEITSTAALTIDSGADASNTLGITSSIVIGAGGGTGYTDEAREYYVQTGINDSFEITVDTNPETGSPVPVRIDEGNYSGDELAIEMERQINASLASEGVSVDVRYDESNPSEKVFRVTSSSRGTGSQIQLGAGTNNFLSTVRISDFDSITEGSGPTTGGLTESSEPNGSKFLILTGTNSVINVGGTDYVIPGGYYTGAELAASIDVVLTAGGLTVDVSYDDTNNTFAIQNEAAGTITLNWTDSSAAATLGYDPLVTPAQGLITGASATGSSVAFNILDGENDTMSLTVDGADVDITIDIEPGIYTGDSLASQLETVINQRLTAVGQDGRVVVDFSVLDGIFTIESATLGEAGSIQIGGVPGTSNLVDQVLGITDFTVNNGSGFQLEEPDDTSNYSTTLGVYDSRGTQHNVSIYFRKASDTGAVAQWEWFAYVPGGDTFSRDPEVQARGTLTFNNSGVLINQTETWMTESGGFDFANVEEGQLATIDFGFNSGTNVSTQFRAASTTLFQNQDGYGSGFLQDVAVDPDGVITGNYSNGQVLYVARIVLANFVNPWGLSREGGNNYAQTRASGIPATARPGSGGTGKISPNSLEQSNVDLSREFVDMIIQQRGFQANSKVITTTDQMLSELINLKR